VSARQTMRRMADFVERGVVGTGNELERRAVRQEL
jgi:hypothetical protein